MGALELIYWILALIALLAQYLLYRKNAKRNIYLLNLIIALVLAFIAFTSFPSNYLLQKMFAVILAITALGSIYTETLDMQKLSGKNLLTVSILGSFLLLFI